MEHWRKWTEDPWLAKIDERFASINARLDSIERTMLLGFVVINTVMLLGFGATFALLAIKL